MTEIDENIDHQETSGGRPMDDIKYPSQDNGGQGFAEKQPEGGGGEKKPEGGTAEKVGEAVKTAKNVARAAEGIARVAAGDEDPEAWMDAIMGTLAVVGEAVKKELQVFKTLLSWFLIFIATIIFFIVLAFLPADKSNQAQAGTVYPKICVDPGHPSSTEGAPGEKELNFKVATDLKTALEATGYPVFMTKNSVTENVDNQERANKCAAAGGKYMIALHADDTGSATDFPYIIYADTKRKMSAQSKTDGEAVMKGLLDVLGKANLTPSPFKGKGNCEENKCTAAQDLGVFVGGDAHDLSVDIIEMVHLVSSTSALDDNNTRAKFVEGLVAGISAAYPPQAAGGGVLANGVLDVPYMNQFTDSSTSCFAGKEWDGAQSPPGGGYNACGGTSLAMVAQYLTGDKKIDLPYIYHLQNNYNHFSEDTLNNLIKSKGVKYQTYEGGGEQALKLAEGSVKKGYPAISHTNPPYAHNTHIMVVVGFDKSGNVYINDPNNCNENGPKLDPGKPHGHDMLVPRKDFAQALYRMNYVP